MLAKGYMVYGDQRYLDSALKCGEVTWEKGLLTKGPGDYLHTIFYLLNFLLYGNVSELVLMSFLFLFYRHLSWCGWLWVCVPHTVSADTGPKTPAPRHPVLPFHLHGRVQASTHPWQPLQPVWRGGGHCLLCCWPPQSHGIIFPSLWYFLIFYCSFWSIVITVNRVMLSTIFCPDYWIILNLCVALFPTHADANRISSRSELSQNSISGTLQPFISSPCTLLSFLSPRALLALEVLVNHFFAFLGEMQAGCWLASCCLQKVCWLVDLFLKSKCGSVFYLWLVKVKGLTLHVNDGQCHTRL